MTQHEVTSPYRGLTPYTEADATYFFGRASEIATITASLEVARLTLFYSPSGVGKTSLLRAGVVHQLQPQARNRRHSGQAALIPVYFNRWQSDPLAGLIQAVETAIADCGFPIADWKSEDGNSSGIPAIQNPKLALGRSEEFKTPNLPDFLRTWSDRTNSDLLLILDQFEEYFLYHPDELQPGTFGYQLVQAVNSIDLRANFLFSLREDALARLDLFKGKIPFLLDNRLSIEHLLREAAHAAVVKPLAQYNQDHNTEYGIEPALVDAVLDQVSRGKVTLTGRDASVTTTNAETEHIEAPYLQLVLMRLWTEAQVTNTKTLQLATLSALGGAETIVGNYLNDTMSELPPEAQTIAARFF